MKKRNLNDIESTEAQKNVRYCLERIYQLPLMGMDAAQALERERRNYTRARRDQTRKGGAQPSLAIIIDSLAACHLSSRHYTDLNREAWEIHEIVLPANENGLVEWIWKFVANNPFDCVILNGISMPLMLTGLLYKQAWEPAVLVSHSEEKKNTIASPITFDQLKRELNSFPRAEALYKGHWFQLALHFSQCFDGIIKDSGEAILMKILHAQRKGVDGSLLNALEVLLPQQASPLMAARFWRWSNSRIDWDKMKNKQRKPKTASIVIPVYGDAQEIDHCLDSLRLSHVETEWEVIAVMNDQSPESSAVLRRHKQEDRRIRAIWPGENTQFALGCNLGYSACDGTWVVFLNNDCRVTDGWLDKLVEPLSDPEIAASQARLLKPDETIQSMGVLFNGEETIGKALYSGLDSTLPFTHKCYRLQALTGACLAIRGRDFAEVRGFDCRYINSQEDIDLCLRLLKIPTHQYCISLGTVDVIHGESKAPGRFNHLSWSRQQFKRRWTGRIQADNILM